MLNEQGFDLWANDYDKDVGLSDEENTYPFAGYKVLLNEIYNIVLQKEKATVLDLGFGTAVLTAKLYEAGCKIYGQDFSMEMLAIARAKMPDAQLFRGDFSAGLAAPLKGQDYDFAVATYSLHHLNSEGKVRLLLELRERLKPGGAILIGDVAFATWAEHDACRAAAGEAWDGEERYFVLEEMRDYFPDIEFEQISSCAGLLTLRKQPE